LDAQSPARHHDTPARQSHQTSRLRPDDPAQKRRRRMANPPRRQPAYARAKLVFLSAAKLIRPPLGRIAAQAAVSADLAARVLRQIPAGFLSIIRLDTSPLIRQIRCLNTLDRSRPNVLNP